MTRSMRRVLLQLLLLSTSVASLDVLVYLLVVSKSHVDFVSTLVNTLTTRGHNVDLVLARLNSQTKTNGTHNARNVISVDFPGTSPWMETEYLKAPFDDRFAWNPFSSPLPGFIDIAVELCRLVLDSPSLHAHLSSHSYDVALVSSYDLCPLGLLHHHGIKPVTTFAATPTMPTQARAAGVPELPLYENVMLASRLDFDRGSFFHRSFAALRLWFDHVNEYGDMINKFNALFRARLSPTFPCVRELSSNVSFDFANSNSLIAEPRPLPHRIKYIGGIALRKPKALDEKFEKILASAKGDVILFSFGTQVLNERIPRVVVGNFVAAFKYDVTAELNASTNVFVVDWLPQTDLLYDSRVSAFISHVGLNSLTEAAFAGVPLISIPLFVDQFHNAWRAQQLGIGVTLKKTELTAANIRDELEKVLRQPSYRARARSLSQKLILNPDESTRTFVESIEYAAKFKDLHEHLTPLGAHTSLAAHLGYDIVAFFLLVFSLAVAISCLVAYCGLLAIYHHLSQRLTQNLHKRTLKNSSKRRAKLE